MAGRTGSGFRFSGMKLLAATCGLAALITAAVNYPILRGFAASYAGIDSLSPLTRWLIWKNGALPLGLMVAGAAAAFTGIFRNDKAWMLAGGIASMALMLAAATIVPAALVLPLEKLIAPDTKPAKPEPVVPPLEHDSIRD